MIARGVIVFALALALAGCAPAPRDVPRELSATDTGTIWFATPGSIGRTATHFVLGPPIVVSGTLGLPTGAGPFPLVVLAHGCGGSGTVDRMWASVLREWGYATFVLDSFTGRGLKEVCTSARTLSGLQRVPDAYGALRILATHPGIDVRRAALMGFSHGGILALTASTVWAKETYAPAGQPAFRAFVPFYPFCNTVYPERDHVSAPLRIHIGDADDWTPAASCITLAQSLKASGQDVAITVYPGALHGFDNPITGFLRMPNVDNGSRCAFRLTSILGPLPLQYEVDECLAKGATLGGNPAALEAARQNVRAELAGLLK